MPRQKLLKTNIFPYHVYARSNNRDAFYLESRVCWEIFCDFLHLMQICFNIRIHAFTLMPNHFHLILSTPTANLGQVMNRFMTESSQAINRECNRLNHVFGGQYRGTVIQDAYSYANTMKYVYRNPVRAGLSKFAQYYPYSTLSGILGGSHLPITVTGHPNFQSVIPPDPSALLAWLNRPFSNEVQEKLKLAISKREFKIYVKRSRDEAYKITHELC